jgi:hypothetical protein
MAVAVVGRATFAWAILHRSANLLDGDRSWLEGAPNGTTGTRLFATRREARAWCLEQHGWIKRRPDCRAEPHGMFMPRVVRVRIEIEIYP